MARDGGTSELFAQAFRDFIPARASVRQPPSSFHFVPKLLLNATYHQLTQELLPPASLGRALPRVSQVDPDHEEPRAVRQSHAALTCSGAHAGCS